MTVGPARLAAFALLLAGAHFAPPAGAQPSPPPIGAAPAWVAHRQAWLEAREVRRLARWNESSATLAAADLRAAAAESLYRASLRSWTPDASSIRVPLQHLRGAALDLLDEGATEHASLLLESALRDDEPLLPVRASLLGRSGRAEQGLALLAWPPDRRLARGDRWLEGFGSPTRGPARDAAHLLTAAALADSSKQRRAARGALWALLASPDAGPSGREEARSHLARRFLEDGTPRLAVVMLADPTSGEQALLLGRAFAQAGDTTGAIESLTRFGVRSGLALSERYPALRRAADLAKNRADSLPERVHLDLSRALGEAGEFERGLALLAARRRAPSDSSLRVLRLETEAGLYARAKRHPEAMTAFRAMAGSSGAAAVRARAALGYARAARGARLFAPMDSAFQSAVALDAAGPTGEQAAWERAREWEDQRSAAETGSVFSWAGSFLRSAPLRSAARVHGAIAWRRAGAADSARAILATVPGDDAVGAYWRARIALASGDSAAARAGYRDARRLSPASYEGIRAGDELRAMGIVDDTPTLSKPPVRVARSTRVDDLDPEFVENRVLAALGWEAIATERVKRVAREGSADAALAGMNALEESGVFRVGQRALVPEGRLDYPPAYPSEVLRAAAAESVSAALLWAIMRQESAYDRQARSKAGAIGLLQLMPATASQLAKRAVPEDSLRDAALNVRLGARYVKALLREFGDARAVLASYNAGEEAVRRWIAGGVPIDDEWVERIPYRETRDYVKQVFAICRRYESLYGSGPTVRPDRIPAP